MHPLRTGRPAAILSITMRAAGVLLALISACARPAPAPRAAAAPTPGQIACSDGPVSAPGDATCPAAAYTSCDYGRIAGVVTDATGRRAASGVTVVATSEGLAGSPPVVTGADGAFAIPLLPADSYTLTFTRGHHLERRTCIVVDGGGVTRADVSLHGDGERVIVTAAACTYPTGRARPRPAVATAPVVSPVAKVGAVTGIAYDADSGVPLAGITVVVTSPALKGKMAELTDDAGLYTIIGLPPGTYAVTFFYADVTVARPNVTVNAGRTVQVDARIPTRAAGETIRLEGRPPSLMGDGWPVIDRDYMHNVPLPGRTFERALRDARRGIPLPSEGCRDALTPR
jgi:hypothetical protein